SRFSGLNVLVVEDEAIVSFLVEEMLLSLGCGEIRLAAGVAPALSLIEERKPDVGVLDVNLSGALAYPIAERLAQLRVPFFFATGYGKKGLAPEWAERPVIQKPFDQEALGRILGSVIAA
ncbi:MAG TPA: response regulator, partial [Acidisoma sp.]|nr:response regulator [Acidisoma sp.]